MDISVIKPVDRIKEILNPGTKEPIGVSVNIMSISDERMSKLKRGILDQRLRLEARGKNFKADDIEENRNLIAFTAMTGWKWADGVDFHGEVPEFNRREVFAVFDELPWFREQIEEEIGEEKDFFPASKLS